MPSALTVHRPLLAFACWMPAGCDWTEGFRQCASCQEYVLIGPADGATSGHEWLTWGLGGRADGAPPYAADGWTRHDLAEVSRWQLSRVDLPKFAAQSTAAGKPPPTGDAFLGASTTVAFRRAVA